MSLLDMAERVTGVTEVTVECVPACVKCGKSLNKEDARSKRAGTRPCRRCRKKERQQSFDTCPADEKKVNDLARVALMSAFIAEMRADIVAEMKANGEVGAVQRVIARRRLEGRPTTVTDLMGKRATSLSAYEPPMEGDEGEEVAAFTAADLNWHLERVQHKALRPATSEEVMSC